MAVVLSLLAGSVGTFAALITLAVGDGFVQAAINYWVYGILACLVLVGLKTIKSLVVASRPKAANKVSYSPLA
ncbi:hypothetical protein ACOTTU_04115 [Roseobacter sp. EG26]|uniref:hypothetical protein n=1 Tax=Roseobacter sp. EG26 TaxID=3412477 RepID=UPI003CE5A6FE